MTKKTKRKLLLIEWVDSHSCGNGWQKLETVESNQEVLHCRSVGWLLVETDDIVVLVPHISGERNTNTRLFCKGDLAIPKRAITRRTKLRT